MDVVDLENTIRISCCGPKNMRPLIAYTLFKDLNVGDFVFVRPHDLNLVLLWMEIVKGDVIKDEDSEYFKMVRVQWWVLVKKGSNLDGQHLYENYWNGKWKCNLADLKQWLDIATIFFLVHVWKNTTNKSQINIPITYVGKTKVNFDVVNASTNL